MSMFTARPIDEIEMQADLDLAAVFAEAQFGPKHSEAKAEWVFKVCNQIRQKHGLRPFKTIKVWSGFVKALSFPSREVLAMN
jgi:hypothetical protein